MEKKSYIVSQQTKQSLAAALKKLMAQKPLEKITISELTDLCHMKRQNFYYHFEDIYDLMRWMFQEEASFLLEQREGIFLWREGLLQLFQYLQHNQAVCLCALHSLGHKHIRRFIKEELYPIVHHTIEPLVYKASEPHSADYVALLTHIYTIFLTSLMESWLLGEIDNSPEELIDIIDTMLNDHLRGAALRQGDIVPTPAMLEQNAAVPGKAFPTGRSRDSLAPPLEPGYPGQ